MICYLKHKHDNEKPKSFLLYGIVGHPIQPNNLSLLQICGLGHVLELKPQEHRWKSRHVANQHNYNTTQSQC